ncbi:beta-ketoacyl synthase N-terminal-like domain-containing protein [Corticibacterium sp. UT-5YL-CI-8]|nr:beta-ketoacyl synthase N-terminal-like domain-containing protein [Tianweitania sp. UT-5YL-CI-8]
MLNSSDGHSPNDIAIVGMALRVPGARNVDEFWNNLRSGTESVRRLEVEELLEAGASPEAIHSPNFVPCTADLPDMEMFDAEFFGLSPREAAVMDPQHRHFLECAWEALEDSGHMPDASSGPVGVFAGCGMGSYFYFNVCSNKALVDNVGMFLLRHTGNDKDFLSTRASFTFDLRGPSVNVQTACSTSLVAIHYACQSLLSGECDAALAGGVTIELPARRGYHFQEGEILSPDGHCRPFDHKAAGTVFGSGVGVVVLRRLSDAIADGDTIHGVIKATAINNDGGAKAGYLAPSVEGQASAVVEAMAIAGVDPETIQYVECHGTGTALGDPIEIEALTQAYRRSSDRSGYCRVGSVKSNIGHLDTAAGVVGVIKTVLALKHGEIPATLGFERANPAIDFAASPFVVNAALTPWPQTTGRRRAAVNSLGVGGTNAHAILEQAPLVAPRDKGRQTVAALVLSARSPAALDDAARRLSQWLAGNPDSRLGDVSHTLLTGRKRFEHNRIVAVRDRQDAIAALAEPARAQAQHRLDAASGAVFMFAGGGAQYRGMAANLYRTRDDFRFIVDKGLSVLPASAAQEIRTAWFEAAPDGPDPLLRPSVQLPTILIVEVAIARMWMAAGVKPAALIGHSMGESAAACIAGVIDFADAVRLVRLRGELFDTIEPGGMLSVPMPEDELKVILPEALDLASVNAPGLAVVSGGNADLAAFAATLAAREVTAARIPIDIAAHSRMLDTILPRWEAFLRTLVLRAPDIPIISNATGERLTAEQATDPRYWVGHLRSTVRFADGMRRLSQDPHLIYIEVGPGKTLSTLAKAQGSIKADQIINSLPHPEEICDDALHLLAAMGRARVAGLPVELATLYGGPGRRINLPTYPFQHRRFFIEADRTRQPVSSEQPLAKEPDLSRWGWRPVWKRSVPDYEAGAEAEAGTWLFFTDGGTICDAMVRQLRGHGHRVATVMVGDAFVRRSETDYVLCPELGPAGYASLLKALAQDAMLPKRIVHGWLLGAGAGARAGSNAFHRIQETGFYSLLNMAKALGEGDLPASLHVLVLTSSLQRVADEPVQHPEKATVLGPGLVIPRELPGTTVRLVDIEMQVAPRRSFLRRATASDWNGSEAARLLWEELLAAPSSEVVAHRAGRRWTRSYSRFSLDEQLGTEAPLKKGGVYLFTGGLGDLATSLSAGLAEQYQARIVLVGRTELPPRDRWISYRRQHRFDAVARGIDAILSVEAKGGEVLYCCTDVTEAGSFKEALNLAIGRFGRIDGVFHAAGVVDDGLMQEKTVEGVENVLAPKLLGTSVLDQLLRGVDIDFLVLFSSTSTVTAPAGQADYVAANAYLDAYADSAATIAGRRTIALHWGIWNEVGLAARATGMAAERATTVSEPANGPFYRRWEADDNGLICLATEIGPDSHWVLDEHRLLTGEAVLPGTAYFDMILQAAREHGLPDQLELKDLVLLRPLLIPDGESRTVRTSLEASGGGWRVAIWAGQAPGRFVKHAEAILRIGATSAPGQMDLAALTARLPDLRRAPEGSALPTAQDSHIRFGPRWKVLKSERLGKAEALGELELRSEHRADLVAGVLIHPALLDIATGFGMTLVDGFRDSDVLWAPASYGRVSLRGPLPERIVSHVVHAPSSGFGPGYAVFDITIADEAGAVVFEAERFVMKRLASDSHFAQSEAGISRERSPQPQAASPKLAAQVRQGILPAEGFEALVRALGSGQSQPIVSSMDLSALRARAEATAENLPDLLQQRPDTGSEVVAARNPLEASLCGYWRDLLGVAEIGIHDSFFDLGGHSLIAVRLFRTIKKEHGVDLPISALFSAPTIAQCAELIAAQITVPDASVEDKPAAQSTGHVHLTLMHPGAVADATPIFICAGMFGNLLNLRHLALHLGADRPVYGLQAKGLFGDMAPHERFDEMARDYLAEMRSVQPSGPYLLAGYSGGGITAFEIARQLRAVGEVVSHIVMLDTPQPCQAPLSLVDKLSMKTQDLRRHRLGYLRQWVDARTRWREETARKDRALAEGGDAPAEAFNNERIELAFRRALTLYEIAPYDGQVTLFRPKPSVHYRLPDGRLLMENRNIVQHDNGWSQSVAMLDVVQVPGDHDSMVLEPQVRVLATRMRRLLARTPSIADSFEQPGAGECAKQGEMASA